MLDNCSESREDSKVTAFSKLFYCGYCINMFAWSPVTWSQGCMLEYLLLSQKASAPPWLIKSSLKEAKRTTARAVVNEVHMFCLETASLWDLAFNFLYDFGCHLFDQPLNALIPLIENGKHYSTKLLPAQSLAVCLREILIWIYEGWKIPSDNFQSKTYLGIHVHLSVYLEARCWTASRTHVCSWWLLEAGPEAEGSSNISSVSVGPTSIRTFPFVKSVAGVKIQIGVCWVRTTR